MSENATDTASAATAAPEAPAPAEPAPQPTEAAPDGQPDGGGEAQQPEKTGPLTKREARRGLRESARQRAEQLQQARSTKEAAETAVTEDGEQAGTKQPKRDAKGNLHDPEDGKFVSKEEQDAAPQDQGSETPAADERSEEQEPEAAERPEARRIPIDADHPVAEMGLDHIEVADEQAEQVVRALLNGTYARRQDVEAAQQAARQAQNEAMELKKHVLRIQASQEAAQEWKSSPQYAEHRERYLRIKETVGEDEARAYWNSPDVQHELRELTDERFKEQWQQVEEQQLAQDSQRWVQDRYQHFQERMPEPIRNLPDYNQWFQNAVKAFDAELQAGVHPHIGEGDVEALNDEFAKTLSAYIMRQPGAKEAFAQAQKRQQEREQGRQRTVEAQNQRKQQRELERAKKEGAEQVKREAADTRRKTPPHPMGALSDAQRGDDAVIGAEAEEGVDTSSMTPHQLKKHLKKKSRQDARRYFGQT